MPPTTIALLDCNVVNYLVRPPRHLTIDPANVVSRLTSAVEDRHLLCIATEHLVSQIAATAHADAKKMHDMFRLLRRLSRGYVLDDRPTRICAERVARRRLDLFDLCYKPPRENHFWSVVDGPIEGDPEYLEANKLQLERGQEDAIFLEDQIPNVQRIAGGRGRARRALDDFHRDHAPLVADWVSEYLRSSPWARHLARDGRPWPPPAEMPSLWNYVSFYLSRLHLANTRRLSPDSGDYGDLGIYSESAYADVLVTDDADMRRIVSNIGQGATRLQTFAEFIEAWASS